jgi:hypothetical protein
VPLPATPTQLSKGSYLLIHYQDSNVTLYQGNSLEVLPHLSDGSVDAVVTDPPYELGFMGKKWDGTGIAYNSKLWGECLRVLKPGGHLLSFGGTRTWHRLACAVEDAGFEIRDSIAWLYGSGFPKSHNLKGDWEGWGTALKPAFEPVVVGRKPLSGTVAANVLAHGVGALNIDGCRVGDSGATKRSGQAEYPKNSDGTEDRSGSWARTGHGIVELNAGRWPSNVLLEQSQAEELDRQVPSAGNGWKRNYGETDYLGKQYGGGVFGGGGYKGGSTYADEGGASRFFPTFKYQAKAPKKERPVVEGVAHPTVKPLELMRWLIRLVTPPDGVVLDPFTGSGTTLEAARLEGFRSIGIEQETDYLKLILQRIERSTPQESEEPWTLC